MSSLHLLHLQHHRADLLESFLHLNQIYQLRLNSNEIDVLGTSPKLSEKFIDKEKEQRLLKEAEEEEKQVQ
ncbi:hypothetical protein A2U94_12185 [Bacillus sp. VT 712]|nr:hypothetical protein A2U94_12185 [Bacillus sp. VT 712]